MPDITLKLYSADMESIKKKRPDAISITECNDYGYLSFIDKIKQSAADEIYSYKGKKVYKVPYNSAFVLVQIWYDIIGGEPFYYDGLQFQDHDCGSVPVTWEMGRPEEFYNRFLADAGHVRLPVEVISLKELKKLKPIKFWFKNNRAFYKDPNGYFYFISKWDLPTKEKRTEYEMFKNNENALFVTYGNALDRYTKWFASEGEFHDEFNRYKASVPPACGTPYYDIKRRGYKKKAPEDRKIAFRLPYLNLDKELEYDGSAHSIAGKWCRLMADHKQFHFHKF
jgi:hypothetical protein